MLVETIVIITHMTDTDYARSEFTAVEDGWTH